MVVITNVNFNSYISTNSGNFQAGSDIKDSKIVNFFELLYSYPAKYKIKWNALDGLKEDLFTSSHYDSLENNLPFIDYIDDWLVSGPEEAVQSSTDYSLTDLREGFLDKQYSSNFYRKQTKPIQDALSSVPIYVILNGLNEIVLNKPQNLESSQTENKFLKQVIYDSCGAFDSSLEKRQQVGFFFMNRFDAETYLQEIAKTDMNGTETVGLAIHCISLDSAYNVTREHHPGIDFRIIPDLQEVKGLLTNHLTKPSIIVENGQQQLRSRKRNVNLFPVLGGLGRFLSPSSSFLQRNEYFKGVPIYIVQTSANSRSSVATQYLNTISLLDTTFASFLQAFDFLLGRGHNWLMQGSLEDIHCSAQTTNYVFFDDASATKFIKNNENKVSHYRGSRTTNLESLVKKPQIFVYNLEDFVELWEEKINAEVQSTETSVSQPLFNAEHTLFISPEKNYKEAQLFFESSDSNTGSRVTKHLLQQVNVKFRVFKSFVGVLFSVGY
jgi:hypothetical protein